MTALSTGNHCKWLEIYDNSMVTLLLCSTSPIPPLLLLQLAKLINHPTGSQNFTTWCNDCISLSMLLILLVALLMKFSKFLQSDSGTSTSFLTLSFFCFTHRQKYLSPCVLSSWCFIQAFVSLCRCKSCLLIPFRCVIYHAEAM